METLNVNRQNKRDNLYIKKMYLGYWTFKLKILLTRKYFGMPCCGRLLGTWFFYRGP